MYDIKRLHRLMLEKGWTVSELARRAGLRQQTTDRIFARGSGHPENVKRLAATFKLKLKDIIKEDSAA